MLKRLGVIAAALALTFAPAGAAQEDPVGLSLNFKPPSFKLKRPLLVLNGGAALPDGVILKLNLSRMSEQVVGTSLSIQPNPIGAGSGSSDIDGKKFVYDTKIDYPGKYGVQVSLIDDLQDRNIAAELKKKAGAKRQWNFEFLVWGDDLVSTMSARLPDVAALVQDSRTLVAKFEKAAASKGQWEAESKPLALEGGKFLAKLDAHELKAIFPAAMGYLANGVRNVVNTAPYYTFGDDGKFSGAKDYHADNNKVKTFMGEEFNWANLKRYVENTPALAGREFCLWIVKDLRRTAGQLRPEVLEAIKLHKAAPGVDFYQERLMKAGFSDIDPLELLIRGAGAAPAPAPGSEQKQ